MSTDELALSSQRSKADVFPGSAESEATSLHRFLNSPNDLWPPNDRSTKIQQFPLYEETLTLKEFLIFFLGGGVRSLDISQAESCTSIWY